MFDVNHDGQLSLDELQEYYRYSGARFGLRPELLQIYTDLGEKLGSRPEPSADVDFDMFDGVFREQVKALSRNQDFLKQALSGSEVARLLYKSCVTTSELAAAVAVFKLLDFNDDGKLPLEDLRKARGIELQFVEDKLEDADTDNDGLLSFEDFLTSYHRPRPVGLSVAIMAAHTLSFWAVLNLLPFDLMFKTILCGILLLRPQIVTNPVIKVYNILKAIWDRLRATQEVAWRPAI